jgi:ATP-dependent 26S proteasome regulatory subunit
VDEDGEDIILLGDDSSRTSIDEILSIYVPPPPEVVEEEDEESEVVAIEGTAKEQAKSLGTKLGMTFDKVGGLDSALDDIVRLVLASRANPEAAKRLGTSHIRGILLSGPPGCGKTLLARELAKLLGLENNKL